MKLRNDLIELIEKSGQMTKEMCNVTFKCDVNEKVVLSSEQSEYVANKMCEYNASIFKMINILTEDLNSRQACFSLDLKNENPNCIVSVHFLIRNSELKCLVYQRSLDVKTKLLQDFFFIKSLALMISSIFDMKKIGIRFYVGSLHYHIDDDSNFNKLLA